MKKMEEIVKLEFGDVKDERLYKFELVEFQVKKKNKNHLLIPVQERNTWICSLLTHFLFADD